MASYALLASIRIKSHIRSTSEYVCINTFFIWRPPRQRERELMERIGEVQLSFLRDVLRKQTLGNIVNKEEAGNYRPISMIGHIMKIFEKEIKTQLMVYLEINDLITIDQSAYRQQHNTHTALHRVIDDWLCNMSDGNLTAVCSFDITKCFDTINHSILLKKMEYYGLQSENIKWFKSYLNEREQMVSCHNTLSGKSKIPIGVPQGSVLGPLLFLIYVNDINRHVHLGACNLYADDTLVYCSGSTMSELKHNIQQCVSDIHEWYDQNKLVINKSKSSVMLATTRQRILHINDNNLDVHIGDYKLVQSDCIDYLGVKID